MSRPGPRPRLTAQGGASPEALLAIARRHQTLGDAVQACGALGFALLEVVTQDEYTHDVVFAAGALFLVYDTT